MITEIVTTVSGSVAYTPLSLLILAVTICNSQLLRSLRGASAELREDYAICLGELGAIDHGRYRLYSVCPSQ